MKKILSVLLAAVMLLSLVGCAQQAAPQQPAAEPAANETAAEGEAAKTEENAASAEPVTITYMRHAEGADVELELVEEFMKENPDIKVVVDSVPANDTYNKLVLSHNAGNPPDVFHTFWTVDAAVNGMIEPLTNYITNEEFEKRFTSAGSRQVVLGNQETDRES